MTTVEILFRVAAPALNLEAATPALAQVREVYGIRRIAFDRSAQTLRVEYDATRLNSAEVAKLVRQTGLGIVELLPLIPVPPTPEEAPAA